MNENVVWILGDQLSAHWPRWLEAAGLTRTTCRIVLIESAAKLRSRPWHRHKLILVLSAMRHFAERLHADGWHVRVLPAPTFSMGVQEACAGAARLWVMRPSTWDGARFVDGLAPPGVSVTVWPNRMFLSSPADLGRARSPLMETFYRKMRARTGVLMTDGKPIGGAWNFDTENRQPPPKAFRSADADVRMRASAALPRPPQFAPDAITRAVIREVRDMPTTWGADEGFALAVTPEDAQHAADDFMRHRLAGFGPHEDAMVQDEPVLFHSTLSAQLNLGLLEALPLCRAAESEYAAGRAPLHSVEGFVRQLIGWREFVYALYWREMPGLRLANALRAQRALPARYWKPDAGGVVAEMACARAALDGVWARGYSHHIQRLMVLSNIALLAGVRPQALNDWFLATYVDAYDWVVTPK